MTYATGDIPVGAYDPSRIANLGIGHGAIDTGGGYTYLNPATGVTLSGVAGLTYNFQESRHAGSKWNRFPF
ncbi:transporter [Bradyrhizobium cytisi]|uniref:transporter n=1 Tax=Bradyrhizobium cytisi TaxID=515489 RepID=UPI003221C644